MTQSIVLLVVMQRFIIRITKLVIRLCRKITIDSVYISKDSKFCCLSCATWNSSVTVAVGVRQI